MKNIERGMAIDLEQQLVAGDDEPASYDKVMSMEVDEVSRDASDLLQIDSDIAMGKGGAAKATDESDCSNIIEGRINFLHAG